MYFQVGGLLHRKKNKIVIIGGGITGCILASILQKNFKVTIYESRSYLGGIMHDYFYDKEIFFNGCQYFNTNNFWADTFFKTFSKDLYKFHHTYGSFTDFNKKKLISNDFALPVFKNQKIPHLKKNFKKHNLKNRYDFYSRNIQIFLSNLIEKYNLDPKKLTYNSAVGIQLDVITYLDDQKRLLLNKRKFKNYNDFFAVKRSLISKEKLYGILPKFGFSKLFTEFHKYLLGNGVGVKLSSPVLFSTFKNNKLQLIDKSGKKIDSDHIIWTGNPTTLVKNICNENLESINTKNYQFNFNLKNKNLNNFYIQIFSTQIPLTKIYIYKINGKFKLSVESISKDILNEKVIKLTKKILDKFKIKLNYSKQQFNFKKNTRYNVLSVKDLKTLKKLEQMTSKSNLIIPNFSVYGRDERVDSLVEKLVSKKLVT